MSISSSITVSHPTLTLGKIDELNKLLATLPLHTPPISEVNLTELIALLASQGIPNSSKKYFEAGNPNSLLAAEGIGTPTDSQFNNLNHIWDYHIAYLGIFEKCFRKSTEFNFEKITNLFISYINSIKENGFDSNGLMGMKIRTILGHAVINQLPALVNALIKTGANVNSKAKDRMGTRLPLPIHYICSRSFYNPPFSQELANHNIQILTQNGCDLNTSECPDSPFETNRTALWSAARQCQVATVISLVKAKADINLIRVHNEEGDSTPLQAVVSREIWDIDSSAQILRDQLSTVKTLVNLSADLFIKNHRKQTALSLAKVYAKAEIASFLKQSMSIQKIRAKLGPKLPKVLINIVMDYLALTESDEKG